MDGTMKRAIGAICMGGAFLTYFNGGGKICTEFKRPCVDQAYAYFIPADVVQDKEKLIEFEKAKKAYLQAEYDSLYNVLQKECDIYNDSVRKANPDIMFHEFVNKTAELAHKAGNLLKKSCRNIK